MQLLEEFATSKRKCQECHRLSCCSPDMFMCFWISCFWCVCTELMCVCVHHHHPGELGDCDPLEHSPELVSEFRFTPKQSEAMEADIFGRWLDLRWDVRLSSHRGFSVRLYWGGLKSRMQDTFHCVRAAHWKVSSRPRNLTRAGLSPHWMKQLGQKAKHWKKKSSQC